MLCDALDQIDTPYVLMLMNDYLLTGPVDTTLILRRLAETQAQDALNYRLVPNPPQAKKNTAYSISCQTGIWNRDFLRQLAARTKSAWEFERRGSFMFDPNDPRPLLVSAVKEFPFLDAVHKGYWERAGVELLQRERIDYDFSVRGRPPFRIRLIEGLKAAVFALLPWNLIVRIQNWLDIGWKERDSKS